MPATLLAAALLWQAAPAEPPPPAALLPYLTDGMPDPDRRGWLRGAFPGATPAQKAEWEALQEWLSRCFAAGTARVRAELAAMGEPAPGFGKEQFPSPLCGAIASLTPPPERQSDWDAFVKADAEAKHVFDTFFYGARLGAEASPFDPGWASGDARMLMHATVREQVYRSATSWPANGPRLEPATWAALEPRLSFAILQEDLKNRTMLKQWVHERGWPTVQQIGKPASEAAWLIVQHADMDPAFQLEALRLMTPLVASGGVSKSNHAYLYDRVMLKIRGKQRYATQWGGCEGGARQLRPLESPERVDAYRAEAGLGPLAEYRRQMDAAIGPCPPG